MPSSPRQHHLSPEQREALELLKPAADDRLRMWLVSRRVNKTGTGDDDPSLLDEVAA
jgi:putative SOS response-associated peptidase YedK